MQESKEKKITLTHSDCVMAVQMLMHLMMSYYVVKTIPISYTRHRFKLQCNTIAAYRIYGCMADGSNAP